MQNCLISFGKICSFGVQVNTLSGFLSHGLAYLIHDHWSRTLHVLRRNDKHEEKDLSKLLKENKREWIFSTPTCFFRCYKFLIDRKSICDVEHCSHFLFLFIIPNSSPSIVILLYRESIQQQTVKDIVNLNWFSPT